MTHWKFNEYQYMTFADCGYDDIILFYLRWKNNTSLASLSEIINVYNGPARHQTYYLRASLPTNMSRCKSAAFTHNRLIYAQPKTHNPRIFREIAHKKIGLWLIHLRQVSFFSLVTSNRDLRCVAFGFTCRDFILFVAICCGGTNANLWDNLKPPATHNLPPINDAVQQRNRWT